MMFAGSAWKPDRKTVKVFLIDHAIEVVLVVLAVGMAIGVPHFMTWDNWMNILRANSLKGIIAFGMTVAIIAGLIDLSIGSTVALSGVIVARMCRDLPAAGMDVNSACLLGIVVALGVGVAIGWIHGVSSHKFAMPPFIVTLVTLNALYGVAGMVSGGFPISNQFPDWFNVLGGGRIPVPGFLAAMSGRETLEGIPVPAVVLLASFAVVYFLMRYTTVGRSAYATGGNAEAARLSGVNVGATKVLSFIIVQVLAVISGFMTAGQLLAGSFSFGRGWELDVIAAVIIGGVSMSGGVGKWWGTVIGALLISVIGNGLDILNVSAYFQLVIMGAIIYFAVLVDMKGKGSRR